MSPAVPARSTASGPVVDIGIPVHRRHQFVASALDGVLAQSYPDWHVTVSEDGPATSSVREAVRPFLDDARVQLVSTGHHLGLARHKSALAAAGTGRYLALLDDDDVWDADWLSRRVTFLERHPECGFVWGSHRDIDPTGRELARSVHPLVEGVQDPHDFTALLIKHNFIATPSVLIRRESYERSGGVFDERFVHINDWELWMRLSMSAPSGFLDVHDCGYRVHDTQMSRRHDQASDYLALIAHLDGLLAEHQPDLRLPEKAKRRQAAAISLSVALDRAEAGDRGGTARSVAAAARLDPTALATARGVAALAAALAPAAGVRAIVRRR